MGSHFLVEALQQNVTLDCAQRRGSKWINNLRFKLQSTKAYRDTNIKQSLSSWSPPQQTLMLLITSQCITLWKRVIKPCFNLFNIIHCCIAAPWNAITNAFPSIPQDMKNWSAVHWKEIWPNLWIKLPYI